MIVSKDYPTDTSLFYSDTIFHIALLSETLSNHYIKSGDLRFFSFSCEGYKTFLEGYLGNLINYLNGLSKIQILCT